MMEEKIILLVEDNPNDEALTLRALKKANIQNEIVVARDGVEALDYLFASGAHVGRDPGRMPQLVLLDIKLPKVDGLEVLRRIRSDPRTQSLPVIVLTTSSEETDIVNSYKLGANSFVRKPVIFDDFVHATKVLGVYWLLVNQAAPDWHTGG
jgi:two-component system response regulator